MLLICVPSYDYWEKIGHTDLHSLCWHSQTRLTIEMPIGALSGDDPCTSDINLVRFCPVLLKLMWLNCIQQASISTQVNLCTFARGSTVVSLLLARGRHTQVGLARH